VAWIRGALSAKSGSVAAIFLGGATFRTFRKHLLHLTANNSKKKKRAAWYDTRKMASPHEARNTATHPGNEVYLLVKTAKPLTLAPHTKQPVGTWAIATPNDVQERNL
jgi:hypothetical protein